MGAAAAWYVACGWRMAKLPGRKFSARPKAPHIDGGGTKEQGSFAAAGSMVVSSPRYVGGGVVCGMWLGGMWLA